MRNLTLRCEDGALRVYENGLQIGEHSMFAESTDDIIVQYEEMFGTPVIARFER